jgi:hypothetical protein
MNNPPNLKVDPCLCLPVVLLALMIRSLCNELKGELTCIQRKVARSVRVIAPINTVLKNGLFVPKFSRQNFFMYFYRAMCTFARGRTGMRSLDDVMRIDLSLVSSHQI